MRRWQTWFFGRWVQLLFWLVIVGIGWMVVQPRAGGPHLWWPFRARPAPALTRGGAARSAPPGGWTVVAKAAMPAVVNIASAKTVRGLEGSSAPFFSDPFFRFFHAPSRRPSASGAWARGSSSPGTATSSPTTTSSTAPRTSA